MEKESAYQKLIAIAKELTAQQPDNDWVIEAEEYYDWLVAMNLIKEDGDYETTR